MIQCQFFMSSWQKSSCLIQLISILQNCVKMLPLPNLPNHSGSAVYVPQDFVFFHDDSSFCDSLGSSTTESPNNRVSTYGRAIYAVTVKTCMFYHEISSCYSYYFLHSSSHVTCWPTVIEVPLHFVLSVLPTY